MLKKKNKKTNYDKFPTTNVQPKKGDVWLAKFPYLTKGNIEKLRPVIITEIKEEEITARMITTNKKRGSELPKELKKYMREESYLTNSYAKIGYDKLYRRIVSAKK